MEKEGYLLVLEPEYAIHTFEQSKWPKDYPKEYNDFLKAFAQFNPLQYKGISRYPLEAYPSLDEKKLKEYSEAGVDIVSNKKARIKLLEIIPESTALRYGDDSFIHNFSSTLEIYRLLEDPKRWEIICVRRDSFKQDGTTLGFDLGYWRSDHFSLIADTIIIPTWHSPVEEDYDELAERLSVLNENLLFDTPSQAEEFKKYYKSKDWAETEDEYNEFCIIQVERMVIK